MKLTRAEKIAMLMLALLGSIALGQNIQKVDQGKPGNQGPWPVTVVGPVLIISDGGGSTVFIGDGGVLAFQGPGADGGVAWSMNVSQWGGVGTSLGQKVMASSVPVVIASDQTPVACYVAMDGGQVITVNQGTSPWIVSNTQVGTASQNVAQFGGSAVVTGTGASGAGIPRVTISNDSSLAANQSVNVNQWGGTNTTLGQKTSAASVPVVLPSDQVLSVTFTLDGGQSFGTFPIKCGTVKHSVTSVTSAAASNCPAAQLAGRLYILMCDSVEGLPHAVKIRVDGVAPVVGVANPGDVLAQGDCITYAVPSTVTPKCIGGNVAATTVTSFECAP